MCTADASTILTNHDAAIATHQLLPVLILLEGLQLYIALNILAERAVVPILPLWEEARLSEAQ
jgi:hypothetical protein